MVKKYSVDVMGDYKIREMFGELSEIPYLDEKMLSSGYDEILEFSCRGFQGERLYLAKRVDNFDDSIKEILKKVFLREQKRTLEELKKGNNLFKGSLTLPENTKYGAEYCVFENELNDNYISMEENRLVTRVISKSDFWKGKVTKDRELMVPAVKAAKKVIADWEGKGISLDKITFNCSVSYLKDIDRVRDYMCFIGLSRRFRDIWHHGSPLKEDSYEVIYSLVVSDMQ